MILINESYEWLYSKISRYKFDKYLKEDKSKYLIVEKNKSNKNRVDFYMSDDGLNTKTIMSILYSYNQIESADMSDALYEENGELYYSIKFKGCKDNKMLSEYEIYEKEWFIERLLDIHDEIDSNLEKRKRKIATFIKSKYKLSYMRYKTLQSITGDDLSFEIEFKKKKNENRAKVHHVNFMSNFSWV